MGTITSTGPHVATTLKPQTYPAANTGNGLIAGVQMLLLSLLVFNHFGRPFEKALTGLKIPAIIVGLGILIALVTPTWKELKTNIGRNLFLFFLWMAICVPFSSWKGGSIGILNTFLTFHFPLFLLSASIRSWKGLHWIIGVTTAAVFFHVILGQTYAGGRMALEGTFGNSDDLALLAGFTLPLLASTAFNLPGGILQALVLIPGIAYLLYVIALTGTRTAIPAIGAMLLMVMRHITMVQRVTLIALSTVMVLGALFLLPSSITKRLATIVDAFDSTALEQKRGTDEAHASTAERIELVKDGLYMLITNPIFGVGPGQFDQYRFKELRDDFGRNKRWFPSHNTYIQVASETGFVGILFYVMFLFSMYGALRRAWRWNTPGAHPDATVGRHLVTALGATWVYFVVCAIAMTCNHHPHQFLLAGLIVSLERVSSNAYSKAHAAQSIPNTSVNPAKVIPAVIPPKQRPRLLAR
jgi:putative inorganic carbon (hco3(-)) transporter